MGDQSAPFGSAQASQTSLYLRSSRCTALSMARTLSSAAPKSWFRQNKPRCCRWQYTNLPQTPLNTAPYPWRTVVLIYRGKLMIEAMKTSSNSTGESGQVRSRASQPGEASVQSFSKNRYRICWTGYSSEGLAPME